MHHRHILGLDILRLAAVTMVMLYHFMFWDFLPGKPLSIFSAMPSLEREYHMHWGWVGVEIFFVISGFVIAFTSSHAQPGLFLRNRFIRLVPANWIAATVILFLLPALGSTGTPFWRSLLTYTETLLFWPLNAMDGIWWTLGVEIDFYLFVWYLLTFNHQSKLEVLTFRWSYLSLAFWVVTLSLSYMFRGQVDNTGLKIEFLANKAIGNRYLQLILVQHAPLFALGVSIYKAATDGLTRNRKIRMAFLTATCWLEIVGQNDLIARNAAITLSPFPALIVWTAAVAVVAASITWNEQITSIFADRAKMVRFVGAATYPMYLLSNSVGTVVLLIALPSHGAWAVWEAVVAGFAAALIVAWLPEPLVRRAITAAWLHIDRSDISYMSMKRTSGEERRSD